MGFCVCVYVCGHNKSNQMWCKLTSSNVACHGLVRQTSLTSLQMENSLCCIVFHRQSQHSRSLFFSLARSLSSWIKSPWCQTDGIMMVWFKWFTLAEHWPSVSTAVMFLLIFDLCVCHFTLRLLYQVRSSSSAGGYFWSEEEVWVWRECAQLFFLYQPLRFGDLERSSVSCSDRVMRHLKYTSRKIRFFVWEKLRACKSEKSRAGRKERMTDRTLWFKVDGTILSSWCVIVKAICFSLWWARAVLTVNSSCLGSYNIYLMRC